MLLQRSSSLPRADRREKPLRILMVVESAGGGTGRHVLDLSAGLISRGHQVHLLYSTRRIDKLFQNRMAEIPLLHTQPLDMRTAPHPSDISVVRTTRAYLHQHGPFDAIHGHSSKGGAIARLAAISTAIPAFYTLHGLIMMDPGLPRWKWLTYLSIELALAQRTARIIAVSPEEQRAAIKLGFGHTRVALVPNGLGPLNLTPRPQARAALGLSDHHLVTGFVGRLVEQKAPEILIKGFAKLAKQIPDARLAVVGNGPLAPDLAGLAKTLGIAEKVLWLGERDARTVLSAFDAFALSSRKEGLPYVVLEAMAAGLPIIATTSAGIEILVKPRENGATPPPDDAEAFGDAMLHVLSNPTRRTAYGQASKSRANHFTVDAMVDRTLSVYRCQQPAAV